jgi:hypothetical protein
MMLSIMEFRMVGSLLVMAPPATSDSDARARALNGEIGGVSSVGRRLGRMILDLDVSVSRVRSAERACSASSSERNRLSKCGST